MPECFWPFAAPYYCLMESLTFDKDGKCIYERWAGEKFEAKIIPFGALVEYKVPPTRAKEEPGKFGGKGTPGIFAGYELGEMGKWTKYYKVWNLTDFHAVNLSSDVYAGSLKVQRPNRIRAVDVTGEDYEFPLRAEYVRKNRTLEGVKEKMADPGGFKHEELLEAQEKQEGPPPDGET